MKEYANLSKKNPPSLLSQATSDKVRKPLIESLPAHEETAKRTGGSIRKYILYAIGEIALVVIGILIALQPACIRHEFLR